MARGLDHQRIFRDDEDRADFVRRLAALADAGAATVYAWALLPNHFHLLVRTGKLPLSRTMRSLLTGYAGAFNRCHRRTGHLFQNRYKSIVVEEDPYFLELVRYLHLNPLRAKLVGDLDALNSYPWSGHAALLGRRAVPWQNTRTVLVEFATTLRRARARYRAFVAEGAGQRGRPELQGGGLVRSVGGWESVRALQRGRERWAADERILGSSDFVDQLLRDVQQAEERRGRAPGAGITLDGVVARVCQAVGMRPAALLGGGRLAVMSRAREGTAYLWIEVLGRSGRALAQALGISPASAYKAAYRGRAAGARWRRLLDQ